MSTVQSGGKTYGWGKDARDLPTDADAYGPAVLSSEEGRLLGKAIRAAGWTPLTKVQVEQGRQVFLISPGQWRQRISLKDTPGQVLQVVESPTQEEAPE